MEVNYKVLIFVCSSPEKIWNAIFDFLLDVFNSSLETCKQEMLLVAFELQDVNDHKYKLESDQVERTLQVLKDYAPTMATGEPNWKRSYTHEVNYEQEISWWTCWRF